MLQFNFTGPASSNPSASPYLTFQPQILFHCDILLKRIFSLQASKSFKSPSIAEEFNCKKSDWSGFLSVSLVLRARGAFASPAERKNTVPEKKNPFPYTSQHPAVDKGLFIFPPT